MPSHRIVLISLLISAYAGNVAAGQKKSAAGSYHEREQMDCGGKCQFHEDSFSFGKQDPKDPYYVGLVESALEKLGISFQGCTLKQIKNEKWQLGASYKVKYVCKGKQECFLHFRQLSLHFGELSPDFPLCKAIHDNTSTKEEKHEDEMSHQEEEQEKQDEHHERHDKTSCGEHHELDTSHSEKRKKLDHREYSKSHKKTKKHK